MHDVLRLFVDRIETPIGELTIAANADGWLRATYWAECGSVTPHTRPGSANGGDADDNTRRMLQVMRRQFGVQIALEPATNPGGLTAALQAYFAGDLGAIDSLPVETAGTSFQRAVWNALRTIPCGTTISYAELARRIGRPSAVRAVGLANGANPVSIVVPCHRVIGSNGALTGYGGGLERKRWLLAHEGCIAGWFG